MQWLPESTAHGRLNRLTFSLGKVPGEDRLKARRRELVGEVRSGKEPPEKEQKHPLQEPRSGVPGSRGQRLHTHPGGRGRERCPTQPCALRKSLNNRDGVLLDKRSVILTSANTAVSKCSFK